MAQLAAYFPASSYGNSASYLGLGSAFLLGLTASLLTGSNLKLPAVRLYGAFRPGVVLSNTVLSAFPVRQGPHPRLAALANVVGDPRDPAPTTPHLVPPYGNSFIFT
jgi:hypothetical protein